MNYHICHIINNLNVDGGAQNIVKNIYKNSNYKNVIIILTGTKPKNLLNVNHLFYDFFKCIRVIYSSKVIHLHLFPSLYLSLLLPFKKKIFTEHNTFNRRRKYNIAQYIENLVYSKYKFIVSISKAVHDSLFSWLKNPNLYFKVIYNGIDFNNFNFDQLKIQNLKKKFEKREIINLCMVGSFTVQKDQEKLIELMPYLPDNFHLILAGDGPTLEKNIFLAKEKKVENRIEFLGVIEDISSVYSRSDIYIHAAHWEGFGLTIIEAAASGLPILASRVEGINEILDEKYMFDNNISYVDLSKKIIGIKKIKNEDYQLLFSSLKAKFSVRKMALEYDNLYSSLF